MFSRKIFIAIAILVMAGMFGMMAKSFLATPVDQVATAAPSLETKRAPVAPQILVAVEDLPAGTFLKAVGVRWQDWPEDSIMRGHIRQGEQSIEDFTGSVVRHGIVTGEPIVASKLVRPGERGFLAAVLTPGKRAASVSVNAVSGNAGLIFPGDRIDVILTQQLDMDDSAPGRHTVGETILRNARVIAVDQRVQDIAQADEAQNAPVAKTVTLEVAPRGAETLAVAAELGTLTLSLRSLATPEEEGAPAAAPSPTYAADISTAFNRKSRDSAAASRNEIVVMRGIETTVVESK